MALGSTTNPPQTHPGGRGRHLKRYSVIAITLHYIFALSYNVLTLWRNVIASISYRSEHIGAVINSISYRFSVFASAFQLLQFLCVQNYRIGF